MPRMTIKSILATSGIRFGTSGARGLVTVFTADVCAAFTQSFLQNLPAHASIHQLAIGVDHRPSSYAMAQACAGAAMALGIEPLFMGVVPTPALAHYALNNKIPAIMVTGSHIPFDRNGLKFYRPDGEISKVDEQQILACEAPLQSFSPVELVADLAAAQAYMQRYQQFFAQDALAGLHIGIYEHSSAGRDLYGKLFASLGATVTSLERSEEFVPIDTEAVTAEDQAKAHAWAKQYSLDAIFSTDGDGDRPLLADEQGNWLRGDVVGLLTAKLLGIQALAVPVNCNSAIELSQVFKQVARTRIGSPYVLEALAALTQVYPSVAGFEANGGFMLATPLQHAAGQISALPTRDALLPALTLLAASKGRRIKGRRISALLEELPARFTVSDRLQQVPTAWSHAWLAGYTTAANEFLQPLGLQISDVLHANHTDGLRLTLRDNNVLHFRASGNAPELRCYVESSSAGAATQLLEQTLRQLRDMTRHFAR